MTAKDNACNKKIRKADQISMTKIASKTSKYGQIFFKLQITLVIKTNA